MSRQQYPPQQPQQPGWVPPRQNGWTPPPPRPPRKWSIGKILGIGCGGLFGLFVLLGALGAALGGGSKTSNASDSKPTHAASAKPTTKATPTPATVDNVNARCRAEHWPQAMPKLAGDLFAPLGHDLECFDHLKAYAPDGHDVMNDTGADIQTWIVVSSQPAAGAQVNLSTPIVLKLREPDAATTKPAPTPTPSHVATVEKPATHEPGPVATHTTEAPVDDHGGATALCNDGTLSYSAHHQGTCSHHHGVAVWYK